MSRVGRSPIEVPSGVEVTLHDGSVAVSGPQGTLHRDLPGSITVRRSDAQLLVERPDDQRSNRALHGLTRSLIQNMVTGVTAGFTKELEMALGFSHPVFIDAPEGVSFEVPTPLRIVVKGIDKEAVGQVAADIRRVRKPEPYKGKGVRYAGEVVQRKAGKAAK